MRRRRYRSQSEEGTYELQIEAYEEDNPSLRVSITYTIHPGEPDTYDCPGSGTTVDIHDLPEGLTLQDFERDRMIDDILDRHQWDDGYDG